ncbi:hypothetical protein NITHO_6590003 [Nitrolancea hollandica Lb]|uniref:Uncharacterized protein n=1 Tax=Nitrolancea hollandica Lb TaxID=1129897 RepID=I4EMU6_9BACT|nr:hypothetical protein NITHO_6590003 [Nitrolancea hollandica Lb]
MDNYDWSVILALYISTIILLVLQKIYLYHYLVSVIVN